MNALINASAVRLSGEQILERSYWFGPNLVTLLATSTETNGAYSLVRCHTKKGFEPPLHVHSIEDENSFILEGEVCYEAGNRTIHAKQGDYIHLPKHVPHTFKVLSDAATLLLLITPGGFEEMFVQCSRPALSLDLPPVQEGPQMAAFLQTMLSVNTQFGVTMLPNL